jgi:hypothetical protein
VQTYADAGVSHFVFDPTVPDLKDVLASMRRFAEDVRPKLRRKARA